MKKFKKYLVLTLISLLVISCGNNLVHEDNAELTKKNGKMIFQGKKYSGEIAESRNGKVVRIESYEDGVKNGDKAYDRKYNGSEKIEIDGKSYLISDIIINVTSSEFEEYFKDGSLKSSGNVEWVEGVMIRKGTWTLYDLEGNVKDTKEFDN